MNNIVNEMGTLVCYNSKWTIKPDKITVIWELCNNNSYISLQSLASTQLVA
jgi:hypothetical protein